MSDMSVVNLVKDPEPPGLAFRPIDSLAVYARNSRTHSPAQVEQIARSIDAFGFTNAVLADAQGIVAGHGRVEAAKLLYKAGKVLRLPGGAKIPEGMVPVVDVSGWTPEQRRAYVIADNQLALNAGWDEELLRGELLELQSDGFDLELLGFSDQELHDLLDVPELAPSADPDLVPDLPDKPVSQPGDVWVMGPHRVICGSCLEPATWDALMAGERADICWTDPPFNVDVGGKNASLDRADGGKRAKSGTLQNDKMTDAEFRAFLQGAYAGMFAVLKPGAPIYVAHADRESINFKQAMLDAGFKVQSLLIWRKNSLVLGMSDYQAMHESLLYGWKPGSKHRWYGGRKQTTVMEFGEAPGITRMADGRYLVTAGDSVLIVSGDAQIEEKPGTVIHHERPKANPEHPTTKPPGLILKNLKASARRGDLVVDGFGGSGSTLIAADMAGMEARLVEIEPRYVDVIVKRWQTFTGRQAVHAETGQPFPAA